MDPFILKFQGLDNTFCGYLAYAHTHTTHTHTRTNRDGESREKVWGETGRREIGKKSTLFNEQRGTEKAMSCNNGNN